MVPGPHCSGHLGGVPLLRVWPWWPGSIVIGAAGGAVLPCCWPGAWGRQRASWWGDGGDRLVLWSAPCGHRAGCGPGRDGQSHNRFLPRASWRWLRLLAAAAQGFSASAARALPFFPGLHRSPGAIDPSSRAGPGDRAGLLPGCTACGPGAARLPRFSWCGARRRLCLGTMRVVRSILAGITGFCLGSEPRQSRLASSVWFKAWGRIVLFGLPTGLLIRARWAQDFQFRGVERSAGGGGTGGWPRWSWRWSCDEAPSQSPVAACSAAAVLPVLAAATVLCQRSRASAQGRLGPCRFTGELVALGQRHLRLDHDGYSRFFGGGDC